MFKRKIMTQSKIIGVLHQPDQIEPVKAKLKDLIKICQRIGIETSPEDVLMYQEVQGKNYPVDELYASIKKKYELNDFPICELIGIKYFHQFYFGMYEFLHKLGAVPIAVGSQMRDTYLYDSIRRYFVNGEEATEKDFLLNKLVALPHFDHHVAEQVLVDHLDAVIIGCDHSPISRLVGGVFIDLSGRTLEYAYECKRNNERLHRTYQNNKVSLPLL